MFLCFSFGMHSKINKKFDCFSVLSYCFSQLLSEEVDKVSIYSALLVVMEGATLHSVLCFPHAGRAWAACGSDWVWPTSWGHQVAVRRHRQHTCKWTASPWWASSDELFDRVFREAMKWPDWITVLTFYHDCRWLYSLVDYTLELRCQTYGSRTKTGLPEGPICFNLHRRH